jgi:addiction module RelB/DinJ family antitoxin
MNMTDAIRIFLSQVALKKGIPFEIRLPNTETQEAMDDLLLKRNTTTCTKEEFDKLFDA